MVECVVHHQERRKVEADYAAWSRRILDETTCLPGKLESMSASSALLWLRYCGVSELWALSVCCKALRGRESAFGAASIVEVTSAESCGEAYGRLRPRLPRGQAVPFGSALLPLVVGDSIHSRPSWLARLRLLRQGATVVVRGVAARKGIALVVLELRPDGRCVELSRRPLDDGDDADSAPAAMSNILSPRPLGAVAYRGSLIVFVKECARGRIVYESSGDDDDDDDDESSACKLTGSDVVRWDPSTALWHVVPFRTDALETDATDQARIPLLRALAQENFRRTICVDSNNRLVVATCKLILTMTDRVDELRLGQERAAREWHVARCDNFPAGREEERVKTSQWTDLPPLRPWTRSETALLVSVEPTPSRPWLQSRQRHFDIEDVALFSQARSPRRRRQRELSRRLRRGPGQESRHWRDATDAVLDAVLGGVQEQYYGIIQNVLQGGNAQQHTDFPVQAAATPPVGPVREGLDDDDDEDDEHDENGDPTSPSVFLECRQKAQSWLMRRREESLRKGKREPVVIAVTSSLRRHLNSNTAVYVLDEALWTWILIGVPPKSFFFRSLSACSRGNTVVLASRIDDAVALDLDTLTWSSVSPPPARQNQDTTNASSNPVPKVHLFGGQSDESTKALTVGIGSWNTFNIKERKGSNDGYQFAHASSSASSGIGNRTTHPPAWPAVLLPLPL